MYILYCTVQTTLELSEWYPDASNVLYVSFYIRGLGYGDVDGEMYFLLDGGHVVTGIRLQVFSSHCGRT